MPKENRQVGHQIIHVTLLLVPGKQAIYSKGVAETRQAWAALATSRLNSGVAKQRLESFLQHPVIQRPAAMAEEYATTGIAVHPALPLYQIALQG